MGWLRNFLTSSIGKKAVMALTGLALGLFLVAHLAGLAQIFRGRAALTAHAAHLHSLAGLLHLTEIALMLLFLLHLGFGLRLYLDNLQAKPLGYAGAAPNGRRFWGAAAMPYSGLILLGFLTCHLASFRFNRATPTGELVATTLAQPATALFYLVALLALGLHLRHGLWSLCQSLGVSHPKYDQGLAKGASLVALLLTALFMTIPLLALGWPDLIR